MTRKRAPQPRVGLDEHFAYLIEPPAGQIADAVNLVVVDESHVTLPQVGGMPDLEPSYLVPHSASANY